MKKLFLPIILALFFLAESRQMNFEMQDLIHFDAPVEESVLSDEESVLRQLVYGILEGLSDKGKDGYCRKKVERKMEVISRVLHKVVEGIREKKSIIIIVAENMFDLLKLIPLIGDCRILPLVDVIKELTTDQGFQNLLKKIKDNEDKVIDMIKELGAAINAEKYGDAGVVLGKLIRFLLDWHVNLEREPSEEFEIDEEILSKIFE